MLVYNLSLTLIFPGFQYISALRIEDKAVRNSIFVTKRIKITS